MRYHYKQPEFHIQIYGDLYICDHPVYKRCTLFKIGDKGLSVIQQRKIGKYTYWTEIDSWLCNDIYTHSKFKSYFDERARHIDDCGLYPTVTIRQIMWALKMKPLKRERWETVFDRKEI